MATRPLPFSALAAIGLLAGATACGPCLDIGDSSTACLDADTDADADTDTDADTDVVQQRAALVDRMTREGALPGDVATALRDDP